MRRILSGGAFGVRIVRLVRSRAIATAGASLLALVALAGCPGSTQTQMRQAVPIGSDLRLSLSPAERSYLESLPVLRLGTDPHWAPMSYVDEHSRLEGISADYLSFIRDSLGVRLRIVPTHSWGETVRLANNGGPTQTLALQSGSVAIDAGDDSVLNGTDTPGIVLATDQRIYARKAGLHLLQILLLQCARPLSSCWQPLSLSFSVRDLCSARD